MPSDNQRSRFRTATPGLRLPLRSAGDRLGNIVAAAAGSVAAPLRRSPHLPGVSTVVLATGLFVVAYYVNQPEPRISPDTASYLAVAESIREHGSITDLFRTPGYPLFMSLVFLLFGTENLEALSIAQAVLFVVAAIEIYAITFLTIRRVWIATAVALLASVNTYQLSFAKGIIVEGFALWTVVTLALAVVLFLRWPTARGIWIVAGALLLAMMTRPEWLYIPVLLFAFMLLSLGRLEVARKMLAIHASAAVVLIYGSVGLYVLANGPEKSYGPFVVIPRIVSLGKVMQYRMHHDAPPEYAGVTQRIDQFISAEGDAGPYLFIDRNPDLGVNHWAPAGQYARATIRNAPVEYLWKTIRFMHMGTTYRWGFGEIDRSGTFGRQLSYLGTVSNDIHGTYVYFPLFAAVWLLSWLLALFTRLGRRRSVHMMTGLAFIGLYQLFVVTAGGYADWPRLFMTLNPVRVIVIFGSALLATILLLRSLEAWSRPVLVRHADLVWVTLLAVLGILGLAVAVSLSTARLDVVANVGRWLEAKPLAGVTVLGAGVWATIVAYRARREAEAGRVVPAA